MNERTDDVPEFVIDKLESYDDDQLSAVAEYAGDGSSRMPDELPEDMVSVFALQDESTVSAIGRVAKGMLGKYGLSQSESTGSADRPGSDPRGTATPTAEETDDEGVAVDRDRPDADEQSGYEGMAQDFIDHSKTKIDDETAVSIARSVDRLDLDEDGQVRAIHGSKQIVVERLADRYIEYLGMAVRNSFADLADEYEVEPPVNVDMTFN